MPAHVRQAGLAPPAQRGIVGALQHSKGRPARLTATAQRLVFATSGMPSR
jgi:hypothetical protein